MPLSPTLSHEGRGRTREQPAIQRGEGEPGSNPQFRGERENQGATRNSEGRGRSREQPSIQEREGE